MRRKTMKIKQNNKVNEVEVATEGYKGIRKKILIGSDDGSKNIIMRYFTIAPQGLKLWLLWRANFPLIHY